MTERKSKTADRGPRLHRFVLEFLRARAQHRGARAGNRLKQYYALQGSEIPSNLIAIRVNIATIRTSLDLSSILVFNFRPPETTSTS
jgi:hypothetical protein